VNYAQLLFPDFSLILCGYLVCRYTALNRPVWAQVDALVYFFLFPVLLFQSIVKSPLDVTAASRLMGAGWALGLSGIALAYAMQGAVTIALAASLVRLWRSPAAGYPLKAAALVIGCALATPYSLDYDLMLLAPAIAYLAADGWQRGFGPWEKTVLAALWFVPLIARSAPQFTLIPLAVPVMLLAFGLLLRRAMVEAGAAQAGGVLRRAP